MTNTQIAFWNYRENKRHDLAMEDINQGQLEETIRHDIVGEGIDKKKAKAALQQAKASLRSSKAALQNAKANLKNAKTQKEKLRWQKKVDKLQLQIKEQEVAIKKYEATIKQQEVDIKKQKVETEIAKMQAEIGKATADTIFTQTKTEYIPIELLSKAGTAGKVASVFSILGLKIKDWNDFLSEMDRVSDGTKGYKEKLHAIEQHAKEDKTFGSKWNTFKKTVHSYAQLYTEQKLPLGVSGTP